METPLPKRRRRWRRHAAETPTCPVSPTGSIQRPEERSVAAFAAFRDGRAMRFSIDAASVMPFASIRMNGIELPGWSPFSTIAPSTPLSFESSAAANFRESRRSTNGCSGPERPSSPAEPTPTSADGADLGYAVTISAFITPSLTSRTDLPPAAISGVETDSIE